MYVTNPQERLVDSRSESFEARRSDGTLLFTYIAVFVVLLYTSHAYSYFYERGTNIKPLYIHLAIMCLAAVALVARRNAIFHKYPLAILFWLGLYLGQLLVTFLLSSQTAPAMDQFIYGLETIALIFAFVVLLLPDSDAKPILSALVVVVLISVGLNLYDFLLPTFSDTYGRAAGLYVNPNTAGKVIAISMVLSCAAVPRRLRLTYCLVVGVGILVTFSRSSWFLWAIGITGLAATGNLLLRTKTASVLLFGSLSVLVIYALLTGFMLDLFQAVGLDQYLGEDAVARLGGGGSAFEDQSTIERTEMVARSFSKFQEHPWIGAGLGATSEWLTLDRPHNLYLMVAVEAGIFGLLVLFALFGILWRHANSIGRVAVIMYAVSSLFAHTNLIQAHMLCLIAIIVVAYPRQMLSPVRIDPLHFR